MTRVEGKFLNISGDLKALSGKRFYGYEIHMGETKIKGDNYICEMIQNNKNIRKDGIVNQIGRASCRERVLSHV